MRIGDALKCLSNEYTEHEGTLIGGFLPGPEDIFHAPSKVFTSVPGTEIDRDERLFLRDTSTGKTLVFSGWGAEIEIMSPYKGQGEAA